MKHFLGFTHYMRVRKSGRIQLSRKTQATKIRRKLNDLGARLSRLRTRGQPTMQQYVLRHLLGHRGYYGIAGNAKSLKEYFRQVERVLFRWLNRRSQRRSFTWERYCEWLKSWYPRPQIVRVL